MNVKILVATHKQYNFPKDEIYLPIQAGTAISEQMLKGCQADNCGENISKKNKTFCELTCLYWAWKNLKCDYVGLNHYRRYFKISNRKDIWKNVLDKQTLEQILQYSDVILPKQRNYYIETTYQQYVHAHNKQDLEETEKIIKEFYPQYIEAYNKVMKSTKGHRFNMMIMRKDLFDAYCQWLFDILFKLELVLDISMYSNYDKRVFGFVSERLLDVWIITNNIKYTELGVLNIEKQNWIKKGANFLKRKLTYRDGE